MEKHCDEGDDGAEELARELHARVSGRHGSIGHGEGFFAEEIVPQAGAGEGHLDEASDDGEGEEPEREAAEVEDNEPDPDDGIEKEPQRGIQRGWVMVDAGIDIILLEEGEEEEEGGEGVVEDLHFD